MLHIMRLLLTPLFFLAAISCNICSLFNYIHMHARTFMIEHNIYARGRRLILFIRYHVVIIQAELRQCSMKVRIALIRTFYMSYFNTFSTQFKILSTRWAFLYIFYIIFIYSCNLLRQILSIYAS